MNPTPKNNEGFTLVELLVVIAIIGLLAGVVAVAITPARKKARDTVRKADSGNIAQVFYSGGCYAPNSGTGDYDIADLVGELTAKYPQYASYAGYLPKDPKTGAAGKSNYHYIYDQPTNKCGLYVNLENEGEQVTLGVNAPTPGLTGIWQGGQGWNGSDKYYQIGK